MIMLNFSIMLWDIQDWS